MSFGARLKEERKRLKLTQTQLAELVGTTKSTQLLYEKETMRANSEYLSAIARVGLDVGYIITGQHGGVQLSAEEAEILALLRKAVPAVRETALMVLRTGTVISKQVNVGRDLTVSGDFTL